MENYKIDGYDKDNGDSSISMREPMLIDGHIKIYQGDLLKEANVDVICHQTNCRSVMGRGIALTIKQMYPKVFQDYKQYCVEMFKKYVAYGPLGTCQIVYTGSKFVANIFGQLNYGTYKQQTDYNALRSALYQLVNHPYLLEHKLSLGFPYNMSCALAGGDWDGVVYPMLKEMTANYPGRVEIWKLKA